MQSFSGPLPHPDLLAKYNLAVPNAAERIIAMAEKQSEHRQALETRVIASDIRLSFLGLIFALILSVGGIASSAYLINQGRELGGGILGGSSMATLAGIFIYGTQQRKRERERKMNLIDPQQRG